MSNQKGRSRRNYGLVWEMYGTDCVYCGGEADSIDHLAPWSYRADNSVSNMVPACMPCNLAAGANVFGTFAEKRAFVLACRGIDPPLPPGEPQGASEPLADDERVAAYLAGRERARRVVIPAWKQRDYGITGSAQRCRGRTSKGRRCKFDAFSCPYHGKRT